MLINDKIINYVLKKVKRLFVFYEQIISNVIKFAYIYYCDIQRSDKSSNEKNVHHI
jgi:hypothetical protein